MLERQMMLRTVQNLQLLRQAANRTGTSWHGKRLLFVSAQRMNEEAPVTPSEIESDEGQKEEPVKLSRRRRRFHDWVQGAGAKFARPAIGTTNYLGETPFPTNRLFNPKPPLSDACREEIYEAYIAAPENRTIRQLAAKFRISLKRVEAVLKLKQSQRDLEANGFVLQSSFAKGMEQYLRADVTQEPVQDRIVEINTSIRKPKFNTMEEDVNFTATDAAKVMGRTPFQELENVAIRKELAQFSLHSYSASAKSEPGEKRHRYLIVDTSK